MDYSNLSLNAPFGARCFMTKGGQAILGKNPKDAS